MKKYHIKSNIKTKQNKTKQLHNTQLEHFINPNKKYFFVRDTSFFENENGSDWLNRLNGQSVAKALWLLIEVEMTVWKKSVPLLKKGRNSWTSARCITVALQIIFPLIRPENVQPYSIKSFCEITPVSIKPRTSHLDLMLYSLSYWSMCYLWVLRFLYGHVLLVLTKWSRFKIEANSNRILCASSMIGNLADRFKTT